MAPDKSTRDELKQAFDVFDTDGSGALSLEELRAVFQRPGGGNALSDEQVEQLFAEFDENGDGVLQFEEVRVKPLLPRIAAPLLRCSAAQLPLPLMSHHSSPPSGRIPSVMLATITYRRQRPRVRKKRGWAGQGARRSSSSQHGRWRCGVRRSLPMRIGLRRRPRRAVPPHSRGGWGGHSRETTRISCSRRVRPSRLTTVHSSLAPHDAAALCVASPGKLDKYLSTLVKAWDKNGDGVISSSEFRMAVRNRPLSVKSENKDIDVRAAIITLRSATPLPLPLNCLTTPKPCFALSSAAQVLFAHFDVDGSGELELKELKPFLKALQVRHGEGPC